MDDLKIVVRKALLSDAAVLSAFNLALARETEDKELSVDIVSAGVRKLLQCPELGFYIVAEFKKSVVGSLMITTEWSDWRNGLFLWIQSVYIQPDYRRQGIYRQLYSWVQSFAQKNYSVCGFRLYVERNNVRAQQAYTSCGMKETPYKVYEDLIS